MPTPGDTPPSDDDTPAEDEQTPQDGAGEATIEAGGEVELPADALFDFEEYLKLYEVAAAPKRFNILVALVEEPQLSTSELSDVLDAEGNELHYQLRKLKDVELIVSRRDPTTGTEETYSYYELTELAHTILTEGILEGMKTFASEEAAIEDKYST